MTNARPIVGLPTVWETTAFGLCARIAASDIQRKKQYDRHLVMAFVRRSTRTVGAGMPLVTAVCVTLEVKPVNDQFEQRFRLLVESLTDYAVFMIDLSGAMSSWNPGVRSLLGYDAEEFIGLPFAAIFTAEDVLRNQPGQELERARTTGRSDDKRIHVRKDGSRFPADGVVTAIRDEMGGVIAFSKVMHDVSAEHHASEALRQSEERYRLLVENVRDYAIFLLDAGGHVASWTLEAERIKGYTAEEIVGRHFRVFFTEEDRRRGAPEQELRTARTAGRAEGEGWRVRKDGSRFWGDEIVAPITDEAGELRGFAKIVRDLTDR